MTTATAGTTLCKKRIYILPSNVATLKCVQYAYRSKNLRRLNMHRQHSISKEDTEN